MILNKKDRLPASFCGADVKLSVEGAFRIVEDMVTEIMGDQKIDGVTCMREYGGMWVFVRNHIDLLQPLGWMEEYTAKSFISSFSKVRLYIDTILEKADGTMVLASRLELCAVDLETGKIRRASTVGVGENTPPEESPVEITYSREKPVKAELLDELTVRSSDIDYCKHTNIISYVRYFMNQYDVEDLIARPVKSIEVQYGTQTHEGDVLKVWRCGSESADAFEIELDGNAAVSCLVVR